MDGPHIRPEIPADTAAIHSLTEVAFRGVAHSDGGEAEIVHRLRADGDLALSLAAVDPGGIVGHIALSPVTVGGAAGWFGLGPVSVGPDRQGQGIGSALVRAALDWLLAQGAAGCVLVGDPGYYGRFGFVGDGKVRYGDVPAQYVQRLVLAGPDAAGAIRYPPAFGDI